MSVQEGDKKKREQELPNLEVVRELLAETLSIIEGQEQPTPLSEKEKKSSQTD